MNDLDTLISTRIDGVRTSWEIDMTLMTDGGVGDGVMFIRGNATVVMLPTVADDLIAVEVMTFRDGERVESHIISIGGTP